MASSRAGLKKVTKVVRGKRGSVKRTYWVKAQQAAKGAGSFLSRHKGKIAAGAALVGAGILAARHRGAIKGAYHGARIANKGAGMLGLGGAGMLGLGLKNRAKAVVAGARVGSAVGGLSDKGRRAVGAARSQLDKVRSIPSAIQGGISGVKLGGRAARGVADAGVAALKGTARAVPRVLGGIAKGTTRAIGGIARATPSLARAGASIGYHANRAKLAARRAVGR